MLCSNKNISYFSLLSNYKGLYLGICLFEMVLEFDVLKLTFDLLLFQNMEREMSGGEEGCTYFEQFCTATGCYRIGLLYKI